MKKVLLIIICLFTFNIVNASDSFDIIPISNRCNVVKDNKIVVPVRVVVTNDGVISNLIDKYTLGYIDNNRDNMKVSVSDVIGDFEVYIDHNRDSEGRSLLYYSVIEDINVKKNEQIMSFNLEIEYLNEVPSTYYLFGNEIVISKDKNLCNTINGYEIKEIERKVYVDLSKVDHTEMINDLITKAIICILIIIVIVLSIIIWRRKK